MLSNLHRSSRTLMTVATLTAVATAACTSSAGSYSSTPVQRPPNAPVTSASSPAPKLTDLGFDFVYDTVTSSFSDGKVWIVRNGASHRISSRGYLLGNPIPSPDGRSLLVSRSRPGDVGVLSVITLSGKLIRQIPHTEYCFPGGWAKDGAIVMSCGDQVWHVFTIRPDGTHRRAIAPDDAGDPPAVSSDGTMVAYGYNAQTWVVPVTGGHSTMVLPLSEGGAWSPDDKHLAVTCHGPDGQSQLDLVNADGSGHRKIIDIPTEGFTTFDVFSPDGNRIVFTGSSDEPFNFYVVRIDGTGFQILQPSLVGGDPQRLP